MSGKDSVIKSFIGYLSHINNKLIHFNYISYCFCFYKLVICLYYSNIAL